VEVKQIREEKRGSPRCTDERTLVRGEKKRWRGKKFKRGRSEPGRRYNWSKKERREKGCRGEGSF